MSLKAWSILAVIVLCWNTVLIGNCLFNHSIEDLWNRDNKINPRLEIGVVLSPKDKGYHTMSTNVKLLESKRNVQVKLVTTLWDSLVIGDSVIVLNQKNIIAKFKRGETDVF